MTCNSHQKMAATVRTLLKSGKMTADKRKPNTVPNTEVFHKGKQNPKQHKNTIDKTTEKTIMENRLRKKKRKPPALGCEDNAPPLDGHSPVGKQNSPRTTKSRHRGNLEGKMWSARAGKGDKLPGACRPCADEEAMVVDMAAISGVGECWRTH
jgi:hypothetical protein